MYFGLLGQCIGLSGAQKGCAAKTLMKMGDLKGSPIFYANGKRDYSVNALKIWCAALIRSGIGKFLLARITMPMSLAGTNAT